MSISREFGETLNECKKIQKLLNKRKPFNFKLCLDVGHGDINSKIKIILILISGWNLL